jgi:hypothetical protein
MKYLAFGVCILFALGLLRSTRVPLAALVRGVQHGGSFGFIVRCLLALALEVGLAVLVIYLGWGLIQRQSSA